jgi:hypothetical protein
MLAKREIILCWHVWDQQKKAKRNNNNVRSKIEEKRFLHYFERRG